MPTKTNLTMERMITNCTDCPLAKQGNTRYSATFICNVSDEIMIISHNEEREDSELPIPRNCPLKQESITITLKQS